jgi:hypothetical protein
MSIVWAMHGDSPITSTAAQMDVLRHLAAGRVATIGLTPPRPMSIEQAWGMRMEIAVRRGRGARPNAAVAAFPAVPAGSYEVSVRRRGGEGWVMVGVGNDQFAIATQPIAAYDAGVRLDLPVNVRALLVRADEGARAQLDAIQLRPLARVPRRLSDDTARRAVRYDSTVVFFFDDRAFPEPSGLWVAGARETAIAVRPDLGGRSALLLRNGAVDNVIELESGGWRQEIALKGSEERRIDLPIDATLGAALVRIRASAGFRPSEVNPASRDTRFLGVFVRPES